jgi:hypothetical protein
VRTNELAIAPSELVGVGPENLPPVIAAAGGKAGRRFINFSPLIFGTGILDSPTLAAGQFFVWCDGRGLGLNDLEPVILSIYIERSFSGRIQPRP